MAERLQKVLANAGIASRRECETWITEGRIKINSELAKLGDRVDENDQVFVDGRRVRLHLEESKQRRVIIYHKKEGEVCTRSDPDGRPTIFENLPRLRGERWVAIGRLDINTSGLLLLTTDGEFANKLMHPSFQVPREYAVRVRGEVSPEQIKALSEGVMLDDGLAKFNDIVHSGGENQNHWYHVVLLEGRNREVRRLWESQGLTVSRLKRVRYGTIVLTQKVRQGKNLELGVKEIQSLEEMLSYHEPEGEADTTKASNAQQQKRQKHNKATQVSEHDLDLEKPKSKLRSSRRAEKHPEHSANNKPTRRKKVNGQSPDRTREESRYQEKSKARSGSRASSKPKARPKTKGNMRVIKP